ncbi:MAG: ribbon-helix-helix protein, CopG family [Acidobacteriota bacterium]
MIRTQIQLDEEQYRKLQMIAREQGLSMAEVVRTGVDLALSLYESRRRWERARALVGGFASGRRDVAERHDRYLSGAFKK